LTVWLVLFFAFADHLDHHLLGERGKLVLIFLVDAMSITYESNRNL
jgi:hypothetical protein